MTLLLALLAAAAVWLAWPGPGLRRLRAREAASSISVRDDGYPVAWRVGAAAAVLLMFGLLWPSPAGAIVGLVAAGGVLVGSGYLRRPTDHRALTRELPDALEFLAVCLQAGSPTSTAVGTVAEVSPKATAEVLGRVIAHLQVGRSAEEAWHELREHPVWGFAARDLVRSARSGTSLVSTLQIHAEDARQARQDAEAKRARTVGVKSVVPLMACFLPAFVMIGVVPIVASLLADFFG